MYDGNLVLGLHETKGMRHGNLFTYSGHGVDQNEKAIAALKKAGYEENIEPMEYEDQEMPGNYIIYDPSGNAFFLTTDFSIFSKGK